MLLAVLVKLSNQNVFDLYCSSIIGSSTRLISFSTTRLAYNAIVQPTGASNLHYTTLDDDVFVNFMNTINKTEREYGEVLTGKPDLPIEMHSTAMPIKIANMSDTSFLREILSEDGSTLRLGYLTTNFII